MSDLWIPEGARASPWRGLANTYCTAQEVLGESVDSETRKELLRSIGNEQAVVILASILRDLDRKSRATAQVEAAWINTADFPESVRLALLAAISRGRRIFPPQSLQLAINEAIKYCPQGAPRNDFDGLTALTRVVLGIGDDISAPRRGGPTWGGLDAALAAEMVANYYANHAANPIDLMSTFSLLWRNGWSPRVDPKASRLLGRTPDRLFFDAAGIEVNDFSAIGIHFWVQADQHSYLRFPNEFFTKIGLSSDTVERFLTLTRRPLDQLQQTSGSSNRYDFDLLRQFPLTLLSDGTTLVIRLSYIIQRTMGVPLRWDVLNMLAEEDSSVPLNSPRTNAFRTCMATSFEDHVGETLRRIFPGDGPLSRVFPERSMQSAWKTKSGLPKICDWVVDCGDIWICVEVVDRVIPRTLTSGEASVDQLDAELSKVIDQRKAKQLKSTAQLLTTSMEKLAGRKASPGSGFVQLIITPNEGLSWNPAVSRRFDEIRSNAGVSTRQRLAICTIRELLMLEHATERGYSAIQLLQGWWSNGRDIPLDQYLSQAGVPLMPPKWQSESASALIGEVADRLEENDVD